MKLAIEEARIGLAEGGIPIGAVLVIDNAVRSRGHNRRVQKGSVVLHAEMDCLENAGRLRAADYARATLYSTLSPCDMCSGAVLLYRIPRVIVAENSTFRGPEALLHERGVDLNLLDPASALAQEAIQLMKDFQAQRPDLWQEDIGT